MNIDNGSGPDFREFVIFYHEIGDEAFRPLNKKGDFLPQRDPLTDAYRPGGRAINYRSEPFGIDQMHLQHEYFGFEDESMAYSAYTFGDTPTTIPRGYLGDPVKWRIGPWRIRSVPLPPSAQRIDPLATKPARGSTRTLVFGSGWAGEVSGRANEVRSRGCGSDRSVRSAWTLSRNAAAADANIWRVSSYSTAMWRITMWRGCGDMAASTTRCKSVRPTPTPCRICVNCRIVKGRMKLGVTSDKLIGTTVDWFGKTFKIVDKSQKTELEIQSGDREYQGLGRDVGAGQGKPGHTDDEKGQIVAYDSTVWDWKWDGNMARGERESTAQNPKYPAAAKWDDSTRPAILFDPTTGKMSWPLFKPHFGKRVPFSANHSGAPWLEPIHQDAEWRADLRAGQAGRAGSLESLPGQCQSEVLQHSLRSACRLPWPRSRGKSRPLSTRTV